MQTLVISGGSSGIGLAVARCFSLAGYRVCNLDIEKPDEHHDIANFLYFPCDVAQPTQIQRGIENIVKECDSIDALVCSAGIHFSGNIEATTEEDYNRVLDINFKGAFFLTRAVIPLMVSQHKGSIVLIGSDQTLIAKPDSAIYGATKAALGSLAKTTALDYARYGVRANLVAVGTVDTPLYRKAIAKYAAYSGIDLEDIHAAESKQQPLGRIGTAEEVAELVYFLCGDKAGFITGAVYAIDGGYTVR